MKITYKGIGSDLKNILFKEFEKNENTLFIFENTASFFEIKREFLQNEEMQHKLGIFQNFKMMNSYDFYENVFVTDKIVVKEEKQVVLFYNALTEKLKRDMKVNNYYDIIDVAYNYYNLFAELQEYKIDLEKIELEKWQVETFGTLLEIDNEMKKVVQQKGLILPYMLRNVENISDNFLNKFSKICFVNKVKITPFEKELIGEIENRGIAVENILQLSENDFNEEKLKIKDSFSLPAREIFESKNINVEIHEFSSKFGELLGLVKKLEQVEKDSKKASKKNEDVRENYRIFEAEENSEEVKSDYQLLKQKKISSNLEITMKDTKIYKILNLIYNLLDNLREIDRKDKEKLFLFRTKDFYDAYKSDDLLNIFNLKESYQIFQDLVSKDYKYISREELERINQEDLKKLEKETQKAKFKEIYKQRMTAISKIIEFVKELEKIYEYTTLAEYSDYLEKIYLNNERKVKEDKNVKDKYFEALSEMLVLEDFSFDNLWDKFFNENVSANLLKLFLKYLDKKAISLNLEETDEQDSENVSRHSINSFSAISETQKENLIFLNIQDTFPKININNYLFTKIQRAKMGLPVSDDEKQIEIFKFYQNILGAKNVYLSYVKNLDENIDSAGVIEEIKLKYAIEAQKNKIDENDELNFIKKYFLENVEKSWESRQIGKFIPSKLKKDLDRIKAEKVSLGYYSFEEMQNFEYGYYLKKMIGNTEVEKIEDKVDNLMFGNIIHGLYEKIVMENKELLEQGKFIINNEEIRKILKSILNSFEYKIPKEYLEFYKKVSFEEIVKSVEKILTKLMKTLENEEEIEIYSEERIKLKSEKEIYENILKRDEIDSTRKESPLKKANDAIEVDTTSKNIEEVKNEILYIIKQKERESHKCL